MSADVIRTLFPAVTSVYNTHRPVLREAVARTIGPILELGMGDGSTPMLHSVSETCDRIVKSYDSVPAWGEKFTALNSARHRVEVLASYDDCPIESMFWSVAFVDHAPEERRVVDIARLAMQAQVVVLHDTEHPIYGYDRIFGLFKSRQDYKAHVPWTSLLSNYLDVSCWRIE